MITTTGATEERVSSRGLLARAESRPLVFVALVAVVPRLIVAVAVAVFFGGSLFPDDRTFHEVAAGLAAGRMEQWDSGTRALLRQTAAYVLPVAGLYRIFGPVVLLGQLVSVALGTATAVLTAKVAKEAAGVRVGLAAGVAAALFPSQVLWSSLTLKDAAVWAAISGIGAVLAVGARQRALRALLVPLAGIILLFVCLGFLRMHTLIVVCWATVLAVAVTAAPNRRVRVAAVALVVLTVPWLFGNGPAGINLVAGGIGTVGERRAANAAGAETAVADPEEWDRGLGDNLRHLPRGITVMLFEPVPWAATDDTGETFARAETVLWYPLLALAALGGRDLVRRRHALAFPFFAGGGVMLLYALLEGNIGTAYRHRGEFVWAVCVFAGVGLMRLWPKLRETDPVA